MTASKPLIDDEKIAAFCRKHGIRRLALFGSILRDDFRQDSDVDVLIEFEPGAKVGFAFFALQDELAEIIDWKVDLNTLGFLSPYIRQIVQDEARDVYAAA